MAKNLNTEKNLEPRKPENEEFLPVIKATIFLLSSFLSFFGSVRAKFDSSQF